MDNNQKSKKYFWTLLDGLLVAIALVLIFFAAPAIKRYGDSVMPSKTFTVLAEGKVTAAPDLAELSFGVFSQGKNPTLLQPLNVEKVNRAIEFLKGQGIGADEIKTVSYNISPNYVYDENSRTQIISGYTFSQTVNVKVRDFGKLGKILGELPGLGINQINGPNFSVENQEKYLAEARRKAFDLAQEKARSMAKANNVRLGKAISFSEYQGGPIPYFSSAVKTGFGSEAAPALPTIEPGTQEVKVQVSVSYAIR